MRNFFANVSISGRCNLLRVLAFVSLGLLVLSGTDVFAAKKNGPVANLVVKIVDAQSGRPLREARNIRVDAYKIDAGNLRWAQRQTADRRGIVRFNLDEFDSGSRYRLKARVLNNQYSWSDEISQPGEFSFRVGKRQIRVLGASNRSPVRNGEITIKEIKEDGGYRWVLRGKTDRRGLFRFDAEELASGAQLVAFARSRIDGSWKQSEPFSGPGASTFIVGNRPVFVRLKNGANRRPIRNERVDAYEVLEDGSKKWRKSGTTNRTGGVAFDLDGIDDGRTYLLKARPFNGISVYSSPLKRSGRHNFEIGNVMITALTATDKKPVANKRIDLRRVLPDGKSSWVSGGNTDEQGNIYFTVTEFDGNGGYVAYARSDIDNSGKYSEKITRAGRYRFVIGNSPLIVTVKDVHSDKTFSGTRIDAYEVFPDGKLKWRNRTETNESGVAQLDLDGLGTRTRYVLKARPWENSRAYSDILTKTGEYTFKVGQLDIKAISGVDGKMMPGTQVVLREKLDDGKSRWIASGNTDMDGRIRFDPFEFNSNRRYLVQAKSPTDGSWKYSKPFTGPVQMDFTVGNRPLNIRVENALSGAAIAARKVTAYEILPDGSKKWRRHTTTDENGRAVLDLDGLGNGRNYILRTIPYNAGSAYSSPLTETGDFRFGVGNVPVRLANRDNGQPFAEHRLYAYQKLANGDLQWRGAGNSDETGTVHFTLPFDAGQIYVFKTRDPFAGKKHLYSRLVPAEGPVEFTVGEDDESGLDTTPPEVSILTPADGADVAQGMFLVQGRASDDRKVESVMVQIAAVSNLVIPADLDAANGLWSAQVPASIAVPGNTLTITATALDTAFNQSDMSISVKVIDDQDGPAVTVINPANGADVPASGFIVRGTVTDNTVVNSLRLRVATGSINAIDRNVNFDATTGSWSELVTSADIQANQPATLTLDASDGAGNTTTVSLTVNVVPVDVSARHLLNRITFGATPALVDRAARAGFDSYLTEQLAPDSIDDTLFEQMIAGFQPESVADLERFELLHMIYSRRQLREVMTWFWDNHFNTDVRVRRGEFENTVAFELAENRAFRTNALGNFRDLLDISAHSPAMLIYLDSVGNSREDANENYIRELLELHTMRVDGGYTSEDVEAGAEIFTGWTVRNGQFFFNAADHNPAEQQFLGNTIAAGGVEQGQTLLDIVAVHPSTARFVCEKLIRVFVDDTPPVDLMDRCALTFLAASDAPDQIAQVVSQIVNSPEFTAGYRTKIKTPVEFVTGLVRNLGGISDAYDLADPVATMGLRLFNNPVPTGWSETGDDWMNSNLLLARIGWVNEVVSRHAGFDEGQEETPTFIDATALFRDRGLITSDAIVGYLLDLAMESDFTELERNEALAILNGDGIFNIDVEDAEAKLRELLGTVLSYPGYQFQ